MQARDVRSRKPLVLARKKVQALLAYLALPAGREHSRERLTTLLWGDQREEQARNSFRQTLFLLRTALAGAKVRCLTVEGDTVALDANAVDIDVAAFQRHVVRGTPAALEEAGRLYTGDLLDGLNLDEASFDEWLRAERERLRGLAVGAMERLLAHQVNAGAREAALVSARRLLELDPWQEAVHRTVMRLQAQEGRPATALRQYQVCVAVLRRELGVEPTAETKSLYREILQQLGPAAPTTTSSPAGRPRAAATSASHHSPTTETPLIGREVELDRLSDAIEQAWQGKGRVIAVVGEAGIGKTRLVAELMAEAQRRDGRVLLGRAYESEQILTLGPWVDAIRAGEITAEKELVDQIDPVWKAELARILPELGKPPKHVASGPDGYGRLFEAVTRLLEHLASRWPLVLVLEDLHWADELSARLLSFVGHRVGKRLVLVVTARVEELDAAPVLRHVLGELEHGGSLVELPLTPLAQRDAQRLVRTLVEPRSSETDVEQMAEAIWTASRGNPFMIVEIVRALHEGIGPDPAGDLPLPRRVRDVIARRLDRLSDRGKQLLAVAAVIGRGFEFQLLQRASGLGGLDAAEGMEELVRRRVLHGVGDGFDFTHDRIRDVAYRELQALRRGLLHTAVATALEERYAGDLEPHYAILAGHYREAGAWETALARLRAAASAARARGRFREAVACLEQTLDVLRHLPDTRETAQQAVDLRLDLRSSLQPLGELTKVFTYLREAEPLARAIDDQRRLGWVRACLSQCFWLTGRPAEAREAARSAQTIAEALADIQLESEARYQLGMACFNAGDFRDAEDHFGRAIKVLEDVRSGGAGPSVRVVTCHAYLANVLGERGEFEAAIAYGAEGMRLAGIMGHPVSLVTAPGNLAVVHHIKGECDLAIALLERGLATCRDWDLTLLAPGLMGHLSYVYALSGRLEEALALLEQTLEAVAPVGWRSSQARGVVLLGQTCVLAGRLEQARALAGQALTLAREANSRGWEAWGLHLLGEIASHGEPPDTAAAAEHYAQALSLSQGLGMRPLVARCHLGLAALPRRGGKGQDPPAHLETATTMFREMDMGFWLTRAEAEAKENDGAR